MKSKFLGNWFDNWRFYGLGFDNYKVGMGILFPHNTLDLIRTNAFVIILTALFAIGPIVTENNFTKAQYYLFSSGIAIFLLVFSVYKYNQYKNGKIIRNWIIYLLFSLYYANVMFIGFYLAVWAEPGKIAGSFIGIIICALLPFTISPILYVCYIIGIVIIYIFFIISFKVPAVWNYDIQNAIFASVCSIVFGYYFNMHRITAAYSINKLEAENIIDTLTQLKNRRDFMNTFQRYVSHHRPADKYLCIGILDVDCFKNYNDYYGHPQGDECLRAIGKVLNELNINKGVYTARIGGEEFALLKHIQNQSDADALGLYVNQIIRKLNIPHEKSIVAPYITVSIGIHLTECGVNYDIKDLYNLADKSLYNAKRNGRNCTIVSMDKGC